MEGHLAHRESLNADDEEIVLREIIRNGVASHEGSARNRFHILLYYGSKKIECYVHKDSASAGAIIEEMRDADRRPKETTLIYKALRRVLQGVANRLGTEIKYVFVTIDPKLILWANASGREIFHWKEEIDADMHQFSTLVKPTTSKDKIAGRASSREERRLVWEYRDSFQS